MLPSLGLKTMNKAVLVFALLFYSLSLFAQVSSFPYSEDFEESDGGWTIAGENSSWQWGKPSNAFIAAAHSGENAWVTSREGNYNNNELSYLVSPRFDFSGLSTDPVLRFRYIHDLEEEFDGAWLEVSSDGGTSWTKAGNTQGQFIYNNQSGQRWGGKSGTNANEWRQAGIILAGLSGQEEIMFRFVLQSDGVYPLEGLGIDKVEVLPSYFDGTVLGTNLKEINCSLGDAEAVSVIIKNQGNTVISSGNVCLEIDGLLYCEAITGEIELLSTLSYTFERRFNLSPSHTYFIKAYFEASEDQDHANDTIMQEVVSAPLIATFSYFEGFDEGSAAWGSYGSNSSWKIKKESTSNAYWATDINGKYNNSEQSFLESPCMDFSAISVPPVLSFDLQLQTEENFDGLWMEISTDGGAAWQKLKASENATFWYNNADKQWWDGILSQSGEWKAVSISLPKLVEESNVKLRFAFSADANFNRNGIAIDNILITAPPYPSFSEPLIVCHPLDTILDAGNPGAKYLWSTGATTQTIPYNRSAVGTDTLWVDVKNDFGAIRDTLFIAVSELKVNPVNDTVACQDSYVILDPKASFEGLAEEYVFYNWTVNGKEVDNPAATYQHYPTDNSTDTVIFLVGNTKAACFITDTILVKRIEKPAIRIVAKEQIAVQDTFRVYGVGGTGEYSWEIEGINNRSFAGKGPHYISFDTPGRYGIQLSATIGGCSFSVQEYVVVSEVTAVKPEEDAWTIMVYPNPSQGSFIVKYQNDFPQNVTYQIRDYSGKLFIERAQFEDELEVVCNIDFPSGVPKGLYILTVRTKEKLFHRKILLE
jgi:hypothetical protein